MSAKSRKQRGREKNFVRRFFSTLGPGVVTGAADDDTSGIATYTIAGAQLGTSLLWTALLTWPLMGCVQFICARIGMVTGVGLGAALKKKIPRWRLPRKPSSQALLKLRRALISLRFPLFVSLAVRLWRREIRCVMPAGRARLSSRQARFQHRGSPQ
jgi:hypothetical protein